MGHRPRLAAAAWRTIWNMEKHRRTPLLAPGNEAQWARINREEEQQEAEFASALSIPERLELGQQLCDQAFEFFNAVRASGNGPQRDPRT
jgi:hypothetical protein